MTLLRRIILFSILLCIGLASCQEDIVSDNPTLRLSFSHDSLLFDTVFTTIGSSTRKMMIYNPNRNAILIDRVEMRGGKSFFINLDGEIKFNEYPRTDDGVLNIRRRINQELVKYCG